MRRIRKRMALRGSRNFGWRGILQSENFINRQLPNGSIRFNSATNFVVLQFPVNRSTDISRGISSRYEEFRFSSLTTTFKASWLNK